MTATYDLATSIGKVRNYIRDTSTTAPTFWDEELQIFLDEGGSVLYAAALALEAWAAALAPSGGNIKLGEYEESAGGAVKAMLALARRYRLRARKAQYPLSVNIDWTADVQVERETMEAT